MKGGDEEVGQPLKALANPIAIWRWGFSLLLVAVGVWLVVLDAPVGGADGRVVGWIVIGYGLVRLVFYRLSSPFRGKR